MSLAGLVAEIAGAALSLPSDRGVVPYLSLSYEANVPTFFSAGLLALCALLLALCARDAANRRDPRRRGWWLLTFGFAYMALDESVELHEHMGLFHGSGVLHFSWVVPAAAVTIIVALVLLSFLRGLSPRTRRRSLIAGAIYVGGAVVMELPLGWWTERHGSSGLGYALIDWAEETMEIVGLNVFVHALASHLAERGVRAGFIEHRGRA